MKLEDFMGDPAELIRADAKETRLRAVEINKRLMMFIEAAERGDVPHDHIIKKMKAMAKYIKVSMLSIAGLSELNANRPRLIEK